MKQTTLWNRVSRQLSIQKFSWLGYFFLITSIFLINTFHESYPDEFDNILGGRYILEGKLPHTGFFTHHGPVAYFLAALIELFSGQSFVRFRLVYSLFLLLLTFSGFIYLRKRFKNRINFYLAFIFILSLTATYFWGHMLLADNLSGFLLVPVYLLIFLSIFYQQPLNLLDLGFISIANVLSLFSSLTYTYLIIIIYLFSLWHYFKAKPSLTWPKIVKPLFILTIPYFIFAAYLFVTNGVFDYIQQNIVFNVKYYIYNYPKPEGSTFINPMRLAIIIANNFYNSYHGLLINVKDFNIAFPFNVALALGNTALLIVLLLNKRFSLTTFVLLFLIYANVRSNPLESPETDYQAAVYIMTALANLTFLLPFLYGELNRRSTEFGKKVIYAFLLVLVSIYSFYSFLFILRKFKDKTFDKYMGKAPLIYDRPVLAPIINKLATANDYMWIGPFEFEELFYAKGKLPSKYHILLPEMAESEEIKQVFITDFIKNKPKVIMFDKQYFIRGNSPEKYARFFLGFLKENYVILLDYRRDGMRYISTIPISIRVDLETKLYINKDELDEVIATMLKENLISVESETTSF